MPLDTSIPLQAQAPQVNPLQQALQVAQFRYLNANGLAQQQAVNANRATSAAYQQATDPTTGAVDNNKLVGILSQNPDAAYNLPQVMAGIQNLKQAQQSYQRGAVGLDTDQLENAKNHLNWAYQTAGAVANNPNATTDDVFGALSKSVANGQITPQIASQAIADMPGKDAPKGALQAWAANHVAQAAGAAQQLGIVLPKPTQVDTGGNLQYVDTNPISNPAIVGTTMQKSLSPEVATSPVNVNGPNNQPGVVPRGEMWNAPPIPTGQNPAGAGGAAPMPGGPMPGGAAPAHFVATAPAMGVQDSNAGTVKTMNDHWDSLSSTAGNANRNIGIANNIQHLADTANTGFGSDRKATVSAILSAFGVKSSGNTATDNDLLNKNVAQLNISSLPGGTDAAKALQSAATPGAKMQPQAIKDAAQYIIGVNKMALAQQQYLQGYKLNNDAAGYTTAKTNFDSNADPRIWAWSSMQNPTQRAAYAKQLQSQDPAIVQKIQSLEKMGILK